MEGLEKRRLQLEENTTKLRAALKQWRTWEWEYETLKEEISNARDPSPSQMLEMGRSIGNKLVTEKEVQDLLGNGKPRRTANQVADMISKRVDYVQQNIVSVEKQLDAAEKKLAGADVLLRPDVENEEGLPLMDIQEELDADGNVISSEVVQPGKAAPGIVEVLKKSGVRAAELKEEKDVPRQPPSSTTLEPPTETSSEVASAVPSTPQFSSSPDQPADTRFKKSVSFAEDTKSGVKVDTNPGSHAKNLCGLEALKATGYNEDLADYNFTSGTKVIELDDDENEIASYPIIPQGESPEDAALRRQMLQYGLSEVGQVVAEMNLEGRDDDYSDDEVDDDYDKDFDSESSEEEDKYGRSTRRELSDEYRREMLELEKRLNAQMLENVGPRPDVHALADHVDDVRTLRVRKDVIFDESMASTQKDSKLAKKGVRFADGLDISPAPQPTKEPTSATQPSPAPIPTMSDMVVERTQPASQPPVPSKPAKVSRFKSARASSTQPVPTVLPSPPVPVSNVPQGPQGQTLAKTIIEHDVQSADPRPPDELDPAVINREVQVEYHKLRNKMIQKQGGFKVTEEELDAPLMEEVDGKPRKVSRFRAARLKSEGL
jgi:unconventional prefoldin RPB5 interactor 1